MYLDRTIEKNFPRLAAWLVSEIPKVKSDARIWDPFLRFSQLTPKQATDALTVNRMPPCIDAAIIRDDGVWRRRTPDKIFIRRKTCRRFEDLDPDSRAGTPADLVMMAIVLHEMVHWGDYKADGVHQPDARVYDPVAGTTRTGDVGFQFEVEAFYGIYSSKWF